MSVKPIREGDGKRIVASNLAAFSNGTTAFTARHVTIKASTDLDKAEADNPWLLTEKLVAKPDQLIKRRGKGNLLLLNATWAEAKAWIAERMNKETKVESVTGVLNTFIVEPFVPHKQEDEYYFCILSVRDGEEILFHHEGGVDVGDVDAKAVRVSVPIGSYPDEAMIDKLVAEVPDARKGMLKSFIAGTFRLYVGLNFGYLEINPLVVVRLPGADAESVVPLDMAAKLDKTAEFESGDKWGKPAFPSSFGRPALPEEDYIAELDSKTGASLKLTVLNPEGRVWTMVAGGGASVVYSDAIVDLGFGAEMANYGEYSGAPSETLTFEYAKTLLSLITRHKRPEGKVLIIGGGIANFTNVAATFKGIIRALTEYKEKLIDNKVRIFVRRGGPNYQEGLQAMRDLQYKIGVPIEVYGPETHLTAIVPMALRERSGDEKDADADADADGGSGMYRTPSGQNLSSKQNSMTDLTGMASGSGRGASQGGQAAQAAAQEQARQQAAQQAAQQAGEQQPAAPMHGDVKQKPNEWFKLFNEHTRCIVYGMQPRAVQGMLDFDYLCKREVPSVASMVYSFSGNHFQKFYWGTTEVLIPSYQTMKQALKEYPEVDVVVNFASFRSVYESMEEILEYDQIRTVAIIAEGVPEYRTRQILHKAKERKVTIIGPATVGGIKPGCFRIGNTGGMLDNVIASKLYRPGSVAYVSRSGGMSNELNNIISRNTNGVYEGIAIGGDRYPGTTFIDHLLRFEADEKVKMMVLLGEVGGTDEYEVVRAKKSGKITKPIVCWCIGTCARFFSYDVQFGHAGAQARGDTETAVAKNKALREAGCIVPDNFEEFAATIRAEYTRLVDAGTIIEEPEPEPPKVPIDYSWAQELGLVRKPAAFISSISDERGEELIYAGMPISKVFEEDIGIGGVLSLLWFRRRLPAYACKYIEMILMVTADHGPAVAGAHNTIVTARAGKDMISSLVSGLCTIGPRFGGAIDGAAEVFADAFDSGLSPQQFVSKMRREHKLIPGIGHRIKSLQNPDMRVVILKDYVKKHFPSTELLDYALEVEQVTTAKRSNLILNVDGCIGVTFVDLLRSCGAFTREEADEYLGLGILNSLFVVGRSIGFIGHYIDQNRMKQGLYRHPTEDIAYI